MSQVRRHDHDTDHHLSPTSTTTTSPLSSRLPFPPPAGVVQTADPSDLNANLIPRNYLQRSDVVTPRPSVTVDTAAHRRPIPSPLHPAFGSPPPTSQRENYDNTYNNNHHYHQNYNNYYHGRASPASSTQSPILGRNPFSSPSDRGSPITPVSSAGFPVPPTRLRQASSVASMATAPTEQVEAGISSEKNESAKTTDLSSQDVTEKTSNPATAAQPESSPPTSPPRQTVPTVAGRPVPRGIPRTSSIDSAISSISSASHSHKSSVDSNALSPADISNLVAAAGSPEAVIAHLLKEKSHAASQNAKLWRLVEKQRAMVLGLNKDLERAMKDKERYRKKVKELQNVPPPLPQQSGKSIEGDAGHPQVSSQISQLQPGAPVTAAVKSEPTELSDADLRNPMEKSGMTPSPLHVTHRNVEPSSSSPRDPTSEPSSPDNSPTKPDINGKNPITPTIDSRQPPSLAIVESSPIMTKSETMSPNVRKAPPAPLNLSRASAHLHHAGPEEESDSDYDDILEVDEIPAVTERGRRKTREEDDREREAAALREQEARSRSSKKPKAVMSPEKAKENVKPPTGQRQMVPQSPPAAGFSHLYPPESQSQSLASVLSPPTSESSSTRERSIPTPLMSPGLPTSPRPGDRPPGSPMPRMPRDAATSPPMSPRNGMPGLPLSPRAPKYPIPLPPNTPMSLASPTAAKTNKSPSSPTHETEMVIPTINATVDSDSPTSPRDLQRGISRRLVSEGYPELLLPPNALPSIEIKVSSSRLRPSRNSYMASKPSEEEPVFTLSVFSRSDGSELWRVEKVILALPQLDQQVKQVSGFSARLPDRSIFSGHSPAKVDARRAALNYYFGAMLDTPMDETAGLVVCRFLTSDAIEPRDDETSLLRGPGKARPTILLGPDGKPRKEGYLTKKGKNFGGWKARYFVLHGPEFKYYESPGGPHLGTIKIYHAQIGRQSQSGHSHSPSENDADDQYRHAFLILEPKRKDSSALVRHVLCAESDEERDAWVEALMQYVESQSSDEEGSHSTTVSKNPTRPSTSSASKSGYGSTSAKKGVRETDSPDSEKDGLRGFSYDDAVPANAPVRGYTFDKNGVPPSPARTGSAAEFYNSTTDLTGSHPPKTISGPTNGTVIQDAGMWGNKPATSGKEKKRSIWGFRARNSSEMMTPTQGYESTTSLAHNPSVERRDPIMPVFGMPLAEAVEYCPPHGVEADLPAVVYRCIEYLTAKGAASEEGIFRLSGSNVVVKALKERFNTEGDVDFLSGDHYYDVHAVASLFKTYLRELPTTVLTRELHLDFLRVLELEGREQKIAAFSGLVHRLPKPNLSLLSALSRFLIVITDNSDVNKMTVRNVGIVFAPTLNIPAPVFSTFLTDYDQIFGEELADVGTKMIEQQLTVEKPVAPDDIRSPRHQMFSDVTAPPAYNETIYQGMESPGPGSHPDIRSAYDTGFIPMQQPSYQQQPLGSDPGQRLDPSQMSSMNRGLAPSNANQAKSKRRESSMLFMGMGNRKSTIPKSRDDHSLVAEDSAFE
ncbi:hypothetical protein FQN54_000675 [Arachnomyces sp. PD_36]|nr:hypothetical protein FQN54_000675 [Arachnomyces sp. PD_36]